MLGSGQLVGFVACRELEAARAFYCEVLGLTLVDSSPFADVYDANGTMLRVTPVDDLVPQPFTVLGWSVDDIEPFVRALGERGVAFERFEGMDQDDLGIWSAPGGARVAWFKDPDGNVLSLTEHP